MAVKVGCLNIDTSDFVLQKGDFATFQTCLQVLSFMFDVCTRKYKKVWGCEGNEDDSEKIAEVSAFP